MDLVFEVFDRLYVRDLTIRCSRQRAATRFAAGEFDRQADWTR